jgi:uncharacterized protein (DUF1697 family)
MCGNVRPVAATKRAASTADKTRVHVALLRGINVGGKNRLPMATLTSMFERAGCSDVRTYIQSGNVVFGASARVAAQVGAQVSAAIEKQLGLRVPLVQRTAAELRAVAAGNPFLREGQDRARLHVAFLAKAPVAAARAALDPDRSPPDRFALQRRELYLCCPNGMARTRLTNDYLDRTLGTLSTVRNWNTVLALCALADELGGR